MLPRLKEAWGRTPRMRIVTNAGGPPAKGFLTTSVEEWRKAIDFCMKKDGATCWVATSSPKCLAVSSTDTAPALIALGARVRLVVARAVNAFT